MGNSCASRMRHGSGESRLTPDDNKSPISDGSCASGSDGLADLESEDAEPATERQARRAPRSDVVRSRRSKQRCAAERQRIRRRSEMIRSTSSSGSSDGTVPATRELLFKLLVIGDYGVGKTAIVRRYTEGKFSSNYKITIGADFALKSLQYDQNTKINLQLWDIAGHERFGYMTKVYYKYAVGAVIVFDVSRIATFHSAQKWLDDIREKVTQQDGSPIPTVLLANKCDIQGGGGPPAETVARFCRDNGIASWFSTSAKENVNVDEAMAFLVDKVMYVKAQEAAPDTIVLSAVAGQMKEKQKSCCG